MSSIIDSMISTAQSNLDANRCVHVACVFSKGKKLQCVLQL